MKINSIFKSYGENLVASLPEFRSSDALSSQQRKVMLLAIAVFVFLLTVAVVCYKQYKGKKVDNKQNQPNNKVPQSPQTPQLPQGEPPKKAKEVVPETPTEKPQNTEELKLTSPSQEPQKDIKQQIIDDYTPQMVEALGGVDKVLELHDAGNFYDFDINAITETEHPILRGKFSGDPALLFNLRIFSQDVAARLDLYKETPKVGELLIRTKNHKGKPGWSMSRFCTHIPQIPLGNRGEQISDGTDAAKYMLNRIERLVKGEIVGLMKSYKNSLDRDEEIANPPTDAYLEGAELKEYMEIRDLDRYEKKPEKNVNHVELCVPKVVEVVKKTLQLPTETATKITGTTQNPLPIEPNKQDEEQKPLKDTDTPEQLHDEAVNTQEKPIQPLNTEPPQQPDDIPIQPQAPAVSPVDPRIQEIIDLFTPELVEALGGIDKVMAFPHIGEIRDDFNINHITQTDHSVVWGTRQGNLVLVFNLHVISEKLKHPLKGDNPHIHIGEMLMRIGNYWHGSNNNQTNPQITLGRERPDPIERGSLPEKLMFDRVRRLMRGEFVGVMKLYPHPYWERQLDIDNPPADAYLEGDEFKDYMGINYMNYYEQKAEENVNEVILHHPEIYKDTEETN